jgi:hypothetical protein
LSDHAKRNAVGTYQESGRSQYVSSGNLTYSAGSHFPSTWEPRCTLQQGVVAYPDHRASWAANVAGPRRPTSKGRDGGYHGDVAIDRGAFRWRARCRSRARRVFIL